jgi:hypothetical protein
MIVRRSMSIPGGIDLARRHGRDLLAQCHGIVGLVGHDTLGRHAFEQRAGLGDVVHLAGRDTALNGGTSGMLVGSNNGGVDEDLAESALSRQCREDPMPDPCARPTRKPLVRAVLCHLVVDPLGPGSFQPR